MFSSPLPPHPLVLMHTCRHMSPPACHADVLSASAQPPAAAPGPPAAPAAPQPAQPALQHARAHQAGQPAGGWMHARMCVLLPEWLAMRVHACTSVYICPCMHVKVCTVEVHYNAIRSRPLMMHLHACTCPDPVHQGWVMCPAPPTPPPVPLPAPLLHARCHPSLQPVGAYRAAGH